MKYMVMECHPAYAVLMGEDSSVVHAANLHYTVGQIVESPVLLREQKIVRQNGFLTMRRCMAAAACLVLMAGAGVWYYRGNYTVYSRIVVSAAAEVSMDISRSGKVLSVHPLNPDAVQLLQDYECRGKDSLTVANELIERAVESGYVQKGDTVHVYYEKEKSGDADTYQTDLEQSIAAHDLNADVRAEEALLPSESPSEEMVPPLPEPTEKPTPDPLGSATHEPPPVPPEPPVQPDEPAPVPPADAAPEPPEPPQPGEESPAPPPPADAPAEPPEGGAPPSKPEEPAIHAPVPPEPPQPPISPEPEAPAAPLPAPAP